MLVYVEGIGSYTKHFDCDGGKVGYVSRAYSSSGNEKSSKSWGAGFISISPNLSIFPDEDDYNPYKLTDKIKDELAGKMFKAEMRTTNEGQEFLALYNEVKDKTLEDVDKFLLRLDFETENYSRVPKVKEVEGLVISDATSINEDGSKMGYQSLILVDSGSEVKLTNGTLYEVQENGELLKSGEND